MPALQRAENPEETHSATILGLRELGTNVEIDIKILHDEEEKSWAGGSVAWKTVALWAYDGFWPDVIMKLIGPERRAALDRALEPGFFDGSTAFNSAYLKSGTEP